MAASSAIIITEVLAFNALVFGGLPRQIDVTLLAFNILVIVIIVTVAVYSAGDYSRVPPEDPPPALLERLPAPLRGSLIALSVTDHYVHVTTDKGTHMLLMRLSDAMRETAPLPGLQIHRSHWVALDAIQSVDRTARRSEVVLNNGTRLPVSRTFLPQLKDAGFVR